MVSAEKLKAELAGKEKERKYHADAAKRKVRCAVHSAPDMLCASPPAMPLQQLALHAHLLLEELAF